MIDLENKKKVASAITIYCSLVIFIIFIAEYDSILSVLGSVFSVLNPILLGIGIAYLLNPILNFYEKKLLFKIKNKRVTRGIGITLTYLSLLAFLTCFVLLIIPQLIDSIMDLSSKFDMYKNKAFDIVNSVITWLRGHGFALENVNAHTIVEMIQTKIGEGDGILKTILGFLAQNIGNILNIPKNILLALFISVYALLAKERIAAQAAKGARALLKESSYDRISKKLKSAHSTFGGYFTGVILDAIFVGIITFLFMLIFNIPYASLVAVVVAITNVIPIFGPFIGAIPSALLIFIADPMKAIIFAILILVIQQIDGNIVAPMILGDSTGMSSLSVIIAITIMGTCFGFVGMFIGVPVFAVIIGFFKELIEERLEAKGMATETAEYYPRNSIVKPRPKKESFAQRLAGWVKKGFTKIFKKKENTNQQ